MNRLFTIMMGLLLVVATACSDDDNDGAAAGRIYCFDTVAGQSTVKIGKGIKRIEFTLADAAGNTLQLAIGSREWILPPATYKHTPSTDGDYASAVANGTFAARLMQGREEVALPKATSLSIVKDAEGRYDIRLVALGEDGRNTKCTFVGDMSFEVGIDDPEASGYTIAIKENAVTDADNTVYPELTKYAITVSDPDGNPVFELYAVNRAGAKMDDLVGTYAIQGYPCREWLADNGWVVYYPEWGVEMAGGSYFTDGKGVKRYITAGQISITRAKDADGNPLYSFSGSGLASLTAKNEPAQGGEVKIDHATYVEVADKGIVLRDQTIRSEVLGRDMLYSVYLPAGWDGVKTYPVLYLLHGANSAPTFGDGQPGNNGWIDGGGIADRVDEAVAAGTAPEMIVVMPNCTVDGKDLFYVDGYQGDARYMTYFFTELLPTVEATLRAVGDRSHRAVGGLSMGGYGSLYYGGLHPEMFCYVYACSPVTYADGTPNLYDLYGAAVGSGAALPGLTIEIGTGDFLFEAAGYFEGFLKSMDVTHDYITRDGAHDWAFWSACAPKLVKRVGETFGGK